MADPDQYRTDMISPPASAPPPPPPPSAGLRVTADQEIRTAALNAAATLIAPALAETAAAFQLDSIENIGGGALRLAGRFERWISDGRDG